MTERVVITGANRGLGLELARPYAARGDEVWAGCRRPAEADGPCGPSPPTCSRSTSARPGSIERFAAELGDAPVDVLVNNGGVDARNFGVPDGERDVLQLSGEHFLDEMRVNALGPLLLTRALLESPAPRLPAPHRERVLAGRRRWWWRPRRAATSATPRRRRRST